MGRRSEACISFSVRYHHDDTFCDMPDVSLHNVHTRTNLIITKILKIDRFGYGESSNNDISSNNGGSYHVKNMYKHDGGKNYAQDAHKQESSSFSLVVSDTTRVIPESTALTTRISTSTIISSRTSALVDASLVTTTTLTASASTSTSAAVATQSYLPTPGNLCSGHGIIVADVYCLDKFLIGCDAAIYAWNSAALDFRNIKVPDKEACHNKCLEDPPYALSGQTGWIPSRA